MNFDEYEAEDFLLEKPFRNYCLGINNTDVQFWQEWITAHPARQAAIQQARELYFLLNGNITPDQYKADEKTFRAKLQQHTGALQHEPVDNTTAMPTIKRTPVQRILLYAGIVAASVILFVLLFRQWLQPIKEPKALPYVSIQETKAGERKPLQLPDGSKVTLNAGSSLKVIGGFNTVTREMELQGEAFFEVAHDANRPFIIHTSIMDIKVLGTVFNVQVYADDKTAETVLLKGSVEVTLHNAEHQKVILHPYEKIVLANTTADQLVAQNLTVPNNNSNPNAYRIEQLNYNAADSSLAEVSWVQNRLVFNSQPFDKIATTLERWYNVKVIFEDSTIANYRYTGVFEQKNIYQVMEALRLSRPFKYTIDKNNMIHIHK